MGKENQPTDPAEFLKNLYEQNEQELSKLLEKNINSEVYAAQAGLCLDYLLNFRQTMLNITDTYSQTFNLPTMRDITRLASQVVQVDEKVDDLATQIEDWVENQDAKWHSLSEKIERLNRQTASLLTVADKLAATTSLPTHP